MTTRRPFITSVSNPKLRALRRLRRRRGETFVVEGYRQVAALVQAGRNVRELYASPTLYLGACEEELVSQVEAQGTVVIELSRHAFESVASDARPDGLLAVADRWRASVAELELGPDPLVLIAEAVERPGNLGTIIRTACAAGADAALVCDGITDPFHPDTIRGSVGTVFAIGIAEARTRAAIAWLRRSGIRIVVATPNGRRTHREIDLTGPLAVVVGNERVGVSSEWLESADATVRIPMPGPADSLNVAVAAGVLLTEAAVQRLATR